jgi:hypothetical protein
VACVRGVGIQSNALMWKAEAVLPVQAPDAEEPSHAHLRAQQMSARELAFSQPAEAWQTITWREQGDAFTSRFVRLRMRPVTRAEQPAEEWLLIEWPGDEAEPTKYWLSSLPADIGFEALVDRAKLRWRIERDYQELKQELGPGHYEGRGWRGFHHHITLCIAAYGFLIAERATFPPSGPGENMPDPRRLARICRGARAVARRGSQRRGGICDAVKLGWVHGSEAPSSPNRNPRGPRELTGTQTIMPADGVSP